jgi:hypothetical protein
MNRYISIRGHKSWLAVHDALDDFQSCNRIQQTGGGLHRFAALNSWMISIALGADKLLEPADPVGPQPWPSGVKP